MELTRPKSRFPPGDGDIRFQPFEMRISGSLPGGAACTFDESERGIQVDGVKVIRPDVQPDIVHLFFMGMFNRTDGECPGDTPFAVIGVDGDVGDEVKTPAFMTERHEADVADDPPILLPDVAGERQRGGIRDTVRPFEEGVVLPGATHVLNVTPAVTVHGAGKAQLDQIRHRGQVTQNIKRAQVRVRFRIPCCGDGDGCHWGNYTRYDRNVASSE